MPFTNGSLKKKIPIKVITIGLFALGGLLAAIIVYQEYQAGPYRVSHDEAVRIALAQTDKEPDRDAALFPIVKAGAKLIHVTNDGSGFVVDEDSLANIFPYTDGIFPEGYENTYLWHVVVYTSNSEGEERGYWYLIDANSGKIVGDQTNLPFDTA